MRRAILFIATFLPLAALATSLVANATLTWTNPTTYTDGAPLTVAAINVYRAASANGPWTLVGTIKEPTAAGATPIQSYTDPTAPAGATAYYYVTAVDPSGSESAPSVTASKAIPLPTPNAPTNLQISGTPVAGGTG